MLLYTWIYSVIADVTFLLHDRPIQIAVSFIKTDIRWEIRIVAHKLQLWVQLMDSQIDLLLFLFRLIQFFLYYEITKINKNAF